MPHILVAGKIHQAGLALLKSAPGVTSDYVEDVSTASYAPLIDRADGLIIRTQPLTATEIGRATRLRVVSRHGVGYDAVDVAALNARGIPLTIVGDVNSQSVAEQTLMLMLTLAKRTLRHDGATRSGDWSYRNNFDAFELSGKHLLLLGLGRIGRKVAALAKAFGMDAAAHDPFVDDAAMRGLGIMPVHDLDAAYATADILSVHIPLIGKEAPVGARELGLMKPTAIVINTARGGLIDETALAAALAEGRIAGAGLDVFVSEPPSREHPLLASGRTVVMPHTAGLTQESAMRMSLSSVQNVLDFFAGKLDPALVVNVSKLSQAATKQLRK